MSLTKKQLEVIDDLFESGGDESAVLEKHNIPHKLWQKWQSDKDFNDAVTDRLESSKRRSRIILAQYLPVAAAKLVQLCGSDKEETARRACLDVLGLRNRIADAANGDDDENPQEPSETLDPATASKILAVLADSQTK